MILRKEDRFSSVVRGWVGETVVLLGGGKSLTQEQVNNVSGFKCIAINDAYLLAPWANVLYFADLRWFKWHSDGIEKPKLNLTSDEVRYKFASFSGQKCSIESAHSVIDDSVHILKRVYDRNHGLSSDPGSLVSGRHSGYQAINLAVLAGAKRILLLGYDGTPGHFHGSHPKETPISAYPMYVKSYIGLSAELEKIGVTVINCSPGSVIKEFQKMPLEDALG